MMTADDESSRSLKPTPRPERQAAFRVRISAESRAAAFLIAKGFCILARRWRSPLGEIDIVARRRRLLVFAEVKARASLDEAAESVNERQRRRIAAAAEVCLRQIRIKRFSISDSTRSWWRPAGFRVISRPLSKQADQALSRSKNSSTCARIRLATLPRSSATAFTVAALERVSWVAAPIKLTSLAVSTVRSAATSTPRAISCVAAPCSVTAAAMALLILPISRIVCSMPVIAAIERGDGVGLCNLAVNLID